MLTALFCVILGGVWDTLEHIVGWLGKHEQSLAIWLEGFALVAIFFLELKEYKRQGRERIEQHKESAAQIAILQRQADALVNSERAWVIAELVPICRRFGDDWHRPIGNGWAQLSENELLNQEHLKHKLKLTNMGRTPAHILSYRLIYSCLDKGVTSLSGKIAERQDSQHIFDHLLGATDSTEAQEIVHVDKYLFRKIKGIKELENTAVFHGWVKYQHVFSDSEVVKVSFCYSYRPSTLGLVRVPEVKGVVEYESIECANENQSAN